MLPLVLTVPLALVGLDLVVLAPSGWTSEAARSRRLSPSYTCEELNMPEGEECEDLKRSQEALSNYLRGDYLRAISMTYTCEELNMTVGVECEALKIFKALGWSFDGPLDEAVYFHRIFWGSVLVLSALAVLAVAFMCQYKSSVTDRRPPLQPGAGAAQLSESGNFASGLCNCFDDYPTCLHAYFCMWCRAGDTYQSAGIIKYWHVIGLVMVWYGWYGLMGWWFGDWVRVSVWVLVLGGIFRRFRRMLRVKLGGNKAGQPNIFIDILLYVFCTCCVVAQEARAYDAATGVKVECCCKLTDAAGKPLCGQAQPLVGQPVQEDQGGSPSSSSSSSGA